MSDAHVLFQGIISGKRFRATPFGTKELLNLLVGVLFMILQFVDIFVTFTANVTLERLLSRVTLVLILDVIKQGFPRTQPLTALTANEVALLLVYHFHVKFQRMSVAIFLETDGAIYTAARMALVYHPNVLRKIVFPTELAADWTCCIFWHSTLSFRKLYMNTPDVILEAPTGAV